MSKPRTLRQDLQWARLLCALAAGLGCLPASSDLDEYGSASSQARSGSSADEQTPLPNDGAGNEPLVTETGAENVPGGEAAPGDSTEGADALPTELVPPATSESSSEDTQQTASESETATEPEPSEPDVDPLPPVAVPPSAAERCLDGVLDAAQTSCYRAVTIPATWDNARIDCNNWGGRLVQVDSGAEDLLIGELVTVNQWLGASDTVIDNVYVWTDGSPILFGNWGLSQPDRFPGADCIEKRETPGRQWFDQPCYNVRAYVCEKGL